MSDSDHSETVATVVAALIANGFIALMKFAMAVLSGSASMLAEGFHSLADSGNQVFLLLGLNTSDQPPDRQHPFGYGKDSFFWAFVVAISMFSIGSVISLYEGTKKVMDPHPISTKHLIISAGILLLAVIAETFALRKAWKGLKGNWERGGLIDYLERSKNLPMVTVFLEDIAALLGLTLALVGLFMTWLTGNAIWDGIGSMTIGVLLAIVAYFLARETRAMLLGERASRELIEHADQLLADREPISSYESIKTMQLGISSVLIVTRVNVDDELSVENVDQLRKDIQSNVQERFPEVDHFYIEVE